MTDHHALAFLLFGTPLAASFLTLLFRDSMGRKVHRIGVAAQVIGLSASIFLFLQVIAGGPERIDFSAGRPEGIFHFGFYVDRLAALLMVHIMAISTIIYTFSIRYMSQDGRYAWFLSLLGMTAFVLLCMISSSNLLMLFLFWQILGILLCFLAFNYAHLPTARGAFRTFVMLRTGDLFFLLGILLAWHLYGTLSFPDLFRKAESVCPLLYFLPGGGPAISGPTAVTLLIFVGAMSKSAQFPLHMWLPDSLYAPTPVHALLHAGIINSGGFLLNRLAPLYGLSAAALHIVFLVGVMTALLGAGMMLTQNDIKKTLGYSTIGQMGYMIMECGLGAFALAIFHLIAHGVFKATIFLNCGHVINAARQEPRSPVRDRSAEPSDFSLLRWLTGFVTTLILPLVILLAAHGGVSSSLRNSQGVVILLFFSWVTSSQAIITLYRLRAAASRKVAFMMLLTLLFVVLTYLIAAQNFSAFLYPEPGAVAYYIQSAALPGWLFDDLVELTALAVILNWVFIYARSHGKTLALPAWVGGVETRIYLFLINRLYLDALALKLGNEAKRILKGVDGNRAVSYFFAVIAILLYGLETGLRTLPDPGSTVLLLASFLLIPLFPFHGPYSALLKRMPLFFSAITAMLMPALGVQLLSGRLGDIPPNVVAAIGIFAIFSAVYGTFKALVQTNIRTLVTYASLPLYAFCWWHLSRVGAFRFETSLFILSVALGTGGLLLAWQTVVSRFGELDLTHIGGLAGTMPRFALLTGLLIMSAMGLPPFGTFSGAMALLLKKGPALSAGLIGIVTIWLAASWYFFRLIFRLLFGPGRNDIRCEDLSAGEALPLLLILIVLLAIGLAPYGLFDSESLNQSAQLANGWVSWNR